MGGDRRVPALVDFAVLVQFSRLVSEANHPAETRPVLAEAAVTHLGVEGAAVLKVEGDALILVASCGLPPAVAGFTIAAEVFDELAPRLVAASRGDLVHAEVMPLIVSADLYGALVLLSKHPIALTTERRELAEAMVDLAAIATARAESYSALERSYAELRESRDTLARTERLRVLGQMAAGVSHDVKNILNPLGLQLELLRRRIDRGELDKARDTIDTMRDVIRHGVDVVERLRDFSRQTPETEADIERVDVDKVVATAVELSRPRLAQYKAIEVRLALGAPPPIRARASELTTAMVNLIVNAMEALGDVPGSIAVTTAASGGGTAIAVADTGPGMSPEVERRVFEPFFTTKPEGTGLGLAMIFAFVQRYDGTVSVDTAPGAGTRFTLWFPAAVD
jgi:signal transduction histidine kinase